MFVPNVLGLYILQNGFLCLPHFVKRLLVHHVAGGFLKNLLFCTLAKAGRQASFDCSTTLIHHNSCWLCTREVLAFLICAKEGDDVVIMHHHDDDALTCTLCVSTGVPVPAAQALWLSN